jgi:hypothetical protein
MIQHADQNSRRHGLSVLEVMVVIVIIGLISGTLISTLSQVFESRIRLAPLLDRNDQTILTASWFRSLIGGIIPDYPDGRGVFIGDRRGLRGQSVSPLGGGNGFTGPGIPTLFTLTFEPVDQNRVALRYSTGLQSVDLANWSTDDAANINTGLHYYDGQDWIDHWPLSDQEMRERAPLRSIRKAEPPPLPVLVRIDIILGGQPFVLAASPHGPDAPLPRLGDVLR